MWRHRDTIGRGGSGIQLTWVEGPQAFGAPGIEPTWTTGRKQAVGTALAGASPVWFTLAQGVLTEVYYPRVDSANTRDLQFLVVDGRGGFWEERRDTRSSVQPIDARALAWEVVNEEPGGRFRIAKRVLTDPQRPAVIQRVRFASKEAGDRLFVLLSPHVRDRGGANNARLVRVGRQTLFVAWRHDVCLALVADCPLLHASCGFVGRSDGWTDLRQHGEPTWEFAGAIGGNVALIGELQPSNGPFTLALGFGRDAAQACETALAALADPYDVLEAAYVAGWNAYCAGLDDLAAQSGDGGARFRLSAMVLKTHEDKQNPGAHIASLAVPWGDASGDSNAGGYHLVWPRDMYHAATGLLAAGDVAGARVALAYLERTQRGDGTWPQNFWVYGEPYWRGLQLDEQAFPILLAWQLKRAGALDHNPYPGLVRDAAYAIARLGPVTQQERWEENSGYSPSTLASCIAALCCAAEFARADGDPRAAGYFLDVADLWATKIEDWTFAGGHYERISPELPDDSRRGGSARAALVTIANLPADCARVDGRAVIDGGFLELVRYGVRAADDPHVVATLAAYDATCRVETPRGPCWHRYTHDGYGQKDDGAPYDGTGRGRAWPLLTGERAHYELAAGRDARDLALALERFADEGGMIPEQVWDAAPIEARDLVPGGPTGSAAPLVWAHAEYIKLLRSLKDGVPFDRPDPVFDRYVRRGTRSNLAIWKFNHKIRSAPAAGRLRLEVYGSAALHWTCNGWEQTRHDPFEPRGHGVWTFDVPHAVLAVGCRLEFTFYWHESGTWEGKNFSIALT